MQNLLYSIRAIKPGNPPFTFDNLPRGFDRGVWTNGKSANPQPTGAKIHFVASSFFDDVDFFQNITRNDPNYDFSNLEVYINGELTDQSANSISASANDDVVIKATRGVYPWFGHYNATDTKYDIDYIKSIEEPLPLMYQADGNPIYSFGHCFYNCRSLTNIPQGLFDNNIKVTSFMRCFNGCSSLTSIPEGLFDKNTEVTTFNGCFSDCYNLTSIPEGLFDNNIKVTNFGSCFSRCSNLTSIPAGLFDKNTQVIYFNACFSYCSSLTAIPTSLFDKNTQVTNFSYCFSNCSRLTSIPQGLFDKNTLVTNFNSCFNRCSNLTVNVQIGSTASSVNVSNFAYRTKEKGTVYCREGSDAYTAFSESTKANVNVLTY